MRNVIWQTFAFDKVFICVLCGKVLGFGAGSGILVWPSNTLSQQRGRDVSFRKEPPRIPSCPFFSAVEDVECCWLGSRTLHGPNWPLSWCFLFVSYIFPSCILGSLETIFSLRYLYFAVPTWVRNHRLALLRCKSAVLSGPSAAFHLMTEELVNISKSSIWGSGSSSELSDVVTNVGNSVRGGNWVCCCEEIVAAVVIGGRAGDGLSSSRLPPQHPSSDSFNCH